MITTLTDEYLQYQQTVDQKRYSSSIDFPCHIHLETFAKCNAACNFCPYPTIERQGTRMSDELIEKIIHDMEDIPRLHKFQLSPFKVNEPFLDNRLLGLLEKFESRLPNAAITLTSNASPITKSILSQLSSLRNIINLWISFNDHRQEHYEATMQLPYKRTIERLDMIHNAKVAGSFLTIVVLSRVGDNSPADTEFRQWVKAKYPLFKSQVVVRSEWLGQVTTTPTSIPPNVGCNRWFEISITSTGIVAHCCMDGKVEYPIGDINKTHLLEIYNSPHYKQLRANTKSRLEVDPCNRCNFL
ncbi:radical SAM/SPASM domain-containing protein [Candidatus Trichorickettsia mobilis]|uniref:radical SAM/SPASM domain-containing protein n=1 Tax=Candidatus Trichorickettsia mobilis TaxID=1346319 RepID=UPI00293079B1|nr:SPASM domain-containing protein [Candidatus Trichorickettsia mobilis]